MNSNAPMYAQQAYRPQYRDTRFKDPEAYNRWLNDTATKKIHFENAKQDLLVMWIDDHGEVLNCNAQMWIYIGHLVCMQDLHSGKPLVMRSEDDNDYAVYSNLIVEKIEDLKFSPAALPFKQII